MQTQNVWQFAQVNVPGTNINNYYIIMDGVVGDGGSGDIAVDDVSLANGNCESTVSERRNDIFWQQSTGWFSQKAP